MRWRYALGLLVAGCKPASFPEGGQVRATGYCEIVIEGPHAASEQRAAPQLLAQRTSPSREQDGYGFELQGDGLEARLFFEDGLLTDLKIVDLRQENDPHIRVIHPQEPWTARGALEAPVTEGAWHAVPTKVIAPEGAAGRAVATRIRFRGDQLELDFEGKVVPASCAWE